MTKLHGNVPVINFDDDRRIITIMHMARGPESNQLYPDSKGDFIQQDELLVSKRFVLKDCLIQKLSISDGDTSSEGFSKWTIDVAYTSFTVEE